MSFGFWNGNYRLDNMGLKELWAAFCPGLVATCVYEFNRCIQHLNYKPKWNFIQVIKRLHLRHQFHNENANFGITIFIPDRLFDTFRPKVKGQQISETVFNLGYTKEEVRCYPWVARTTDDIDEESAISEGIERRIIAKEALGGAA